MKKIFTLCMSLFMGCVVASAQSVTDVDGVFQFTDPEGNVYADGSHLIYNKVESTPMSSVIHSDLWVRNVSESEAGQVVVTSTVTSLEGNGQFQICWPTSCVSLTAPGTLEGVAGGPVGYAANLQTEYVIYGTEGSCEVTYSITRRMVDGTSYPGSTITVLYTTDPNASGISGVTVEGSNEIVARYTRDGLKIDEPQKGINIVKYADGRTEKVLVK